MNKTFESILIIVAILILLFITSLGLKAIMRFIIKIIKSVANEFKIDSKKSKFETIDLYAVIFFFVLTIFLFICEITPSILKQLIGVDFSNQNYSLSKTSLVFMFVVVLFSGTGAFIIQIQNQQIELIRKLKKK